MAEERVRRRLAAILAADVVGYSRLMRADEAGTLARLKALRADLLDPKVAEYGGRIVKTMGDGVLIEFPSAVDAVQHAIDVQSALAERNAAVPEARRIELRMGINIGDVIVEGDDIYGDGVNVAARLEALAAPGGICISDDVHRQIRGRLDCGFDDLGAQRVKNIPEPVRVFRVTRGPAGAAGSEPAQGAPMFRRPAVAVLPFENIGGDPEQDYFADGLTEDIITALSLWRTFPVIARNSTFTYKGRAVKAQEVARELGARYVIEGSVRKGGDRLRVAVQLIDAETDRHVWAETFDRKLENIFAIQDEITRRVGALIEPEMNWAEQRRSLEKTVTSLDAWDCFQRGMHLLHQYTAEANRDAREMFERATALDPGYAPAFVYLAYTYYQDLRWGYPGRPDDALARLFDAVRRAVTLDNLDARAHWMLGLGYQVSEEYDLAIAEGERAVALNGCFAVAHFGLGGSYYHAGRCKDGARSFQTAISLNPRDPRNAVILTNLARCLLETGQFDEAVEAARQAIPIRPNDLHVHLALVSGLALAGRSAEARTALEKCHRVEPGLFEKTRDQIIYQGACDPTRFVADRFFEGLRKAGWNV